MLISFHPLRTIDAAGETRQGGTMLSGLRLMVLMVALVLPQASPLTAGTITAVMNSCIDSAPKPSVYFGVHVPGWLDDLGRELYPFEAHAQKKAAIVMLYQGWGITDGTQNFQTSWMDNIRNHGSIPMVSWEPWLYTAGVNQPKYQLADIISGNFDPYIKKWADDSKTWGHPYFLRFAAEMNGNWFSWSEGVNGNQSGEYVQAWRHVHDIFASREVTNVTWVWSPNIEYNGSTPLEGLFPGDDYVDWLGMDGYNWGTVPHAPGAVSPHSIDSDQSTIVTGWQTFSQVFAQTYAHLTALSTKPLMVAEMASAEQGGSKAAWITDALSTQIPCNFKRIRAFIWFNENKETDWRIESSPSAQHAFAAAIQPGFYATNQYNSLKQSPIPVPIASARQVSLSGQDGWVRESAETSNTGGSMNNTATTIRIGDDVARRQYRSILSFKTSGLPDNAVITSVRLKLKHSSISPTGTDPIHLLQGIFVDIRKGTFGTQPALQLIDFQAVANQKAGPFRPVLLGGWYTISLNSKTFASINKRATNGGLTQFRLRFKWDDNNDTVANLLSIASGNNASPTDKPVLIIGYYVP
jgi:hypothetical protein